MVCYEQGDALGVLEAFGFIIVPINSSHTTHTLETMAFSDPLILTVDSVAREYARQSDGKYINSSSTLAEPESLVFERTLNPMGTSSFLAKVTTHKIFVSPSGSEQKDSLSVYTVIKQPHRSFDASDIELSLNILNTFLGSSLLPRFLIGER